MRDTRWRVLCAVLAACALGGCSSETDGQAAPVEDPGQRMSSAASSAPEQSQAPDSAAPRAANPLDVRKLKENPCDLLTDNQTRQLFGRVEAGRSRDVELGAACSWGTTSRDSAGVLLTGSFPDRTSLSVLYDGRKRFNIFQPVASVAGYPALINLLYDTRPDGECMLNVGVNAQQVLTVQVTVRGGQDPAANFDNPCGVAREAAEVMMRTVKARG